uniref:Uncharacterized protein n=1 Tax=Arion vulgaris TaxID=1028688 RepID=A0A0B6Y7U0_9EUPU
MIHELEVDSWEQETMNRNAWREKIMESGIRREVKLIAEGIRAESLQRHIRE